VFKLLALALLQRLPDRAASRFDEGPFVVTEILTERARRMRLRSRYGVLPGRDARKPAHPTFTAVGWR
jgi:hypothetical protein